MGSVVSALLWLGSSSSLKVSVPFWTSAQCFLLFEANTLHRCSSFFFPTLAILHELVGPAIDTMRQLEIGKKVIHIVAFHTFPATDLVAVFTEALDFGLISVAFETSESISFSGNIISDFELGSSCSLNLSSSGGLEIGIDVSAVHSFTSYSFPSEFSSSILVSPSTLACS
nr:hypothetical protein Iba_chr13bCG1800 [Ipomoea batatas]